MDTLLLAALLVLNLALLAVALFAFRRSSEWRAEADASASRYPIV
jgi:cbb3-type cytochrome oxidase subunit 3